MRHFRLLAILLLMAGCNKVKKDAEVITPSKYLYVASGTCYAGNGVTTFTNLNSSNLIYRINLATGVREDIIADYYASPSNAGDSPVSIVDYDDTHLLVLVENTTTVSLRRIELVEKKANGARVTYSNNTTSLSAQLRRMRKLSDSYLLVSKSTAVEKQKDGANRLTIGANAWLTLSTPVSACTTSSTLITSMAQLTNGMLVFGHAAASQSRIGVVSPLGYTVAGDCKSAQVAPNVASFPTSMFYDSANQKLIVTYAASTTGVDMNTIYSYNIDETTGAISSPQKLYDSNLFGSTYNYLLFGTSASAYDPETHQVYVASSRDTNAAVTNFLIEKFTYDPTQIGVANPSVLVPAGAPFYTYGNDTKCISDMIIAK